MAEGYSATLENGEDIYIPPWPVDVSLENLARAGKSLGNDNVVLISKLNIPAVINGIMNSKDPEETANLIKHFVCQARISGKKITPDTLDEIFTNKLAMITEVFAHVMHYQYNDFFELGLAKETFPSSSETGTRQYP